MDIPHYQQCQQMDKIQIKEKEWNKVLNLFDGYSAKKEDQKAKKEKMDPLKV